MKIISSTDIVILVTEPVKIEVDLQGIDEPVIDKYFTRLNHGEFIATAELFAAQGCLNPPFDKQLQGREAIAQYLAKEAIGIGFFPEYGKLVPALDDDRIQYQIQGKVEMNWFSVNVSWSIELNAAKEITLVEVKLLASLDDLLSFSHI